MPDERCIDFVSLSDLERQRASQIMFPRTMRELRTLSGATHDAWLSIA